MPKSKAKINSAILDHIFTVGSGYREDLFAWDPGIGCWRALLTDEELARRVEAETELICSADQIWRWRKKMLIAPVQRGGARPGAGRPRKTQETQEVGVPDAYDRVIFLHRQDVYVLSKFTVYGQGISHGVDSYSLTTSPTTAAVVALPGTGGGKKGRRGGRSDRRMAVARLA
ncbi:hypothetical protein [Syntrophothermus lipocalidus]|uniref:Uncharacterized protein n=1 Tax=Syntrophothermus lipocalidus (strain DSM 12680 / TGB-C1) TaxID=643648 RepID=D7CQ12_SYNLT|nr:hypothetical protein [Syntrophothermus lipocalidus]ADI02790.1 hypothetical protein Slip_2043 [Syntrophothermus lipocalidus DSM 12680]